MTSAPPTPTIPEWLIDAAKQFAAAYTLGGRVSPLGLMAAAWVAGWEAAQPTEDHPDEDADPRPASMLRRVDFDDSPDNPAGSAP